MSYLVLARKYRPSQFSELVGQTHIVQTLSNALKNKHLHHAFLFTGVRGVGKTSVARIFAKSLNCQAGISDKPCNKCQSCLSIAGGSAIDLIEFDAASRTGVDDMRDILENAQYLPSNSRFKIYLIDEVHMLSNSSFNALLKTLEEPPAHIKFLFATTDAQKIPVTILSRCLSLNLQKIDTETISKQLHKIAKKEAYPFEEKALNYIAKFSDGSMRDALSLLDQAIAYGDKTIKTDDVIAMLGVVNHQTLTTLMELLFTNNAQGLLDLSEKLANQGENLSQLLTQLMQQLHQLMLIQSQIKNQDDTLNKLAKMVDKQQLQLLYQIALQGHKDLKFAPNQQMGLEITLLRMITFVFDEDEKQSNSVDDTAEKKTKK